MAVAEQTAVMRIRWVRHTQTGLRSKISMIRSAERQRLAQQGSNGFRSIMPTSPSRSSTGLETNAAGGSNFRIDPLQTAQRLWLQTRQNVPASNASRSANRQ